MLKQIESHGKKILQRVLLFILKNSSNKIISPDKIKKILVFRLDQRIGNGLLLLPLLSGIKNSRPDAKLHFLIHAPVSELIESFSGAIIQRHWAYRQKYLLKNPLRFLKLIRLLKKENYDLIISSSNPDNFSLSQAVFGLFCKPKMLVGFDWKNSNKFYDISVQGNANIHYSMSQLDLWKKFYPDANAENSILDISESDRQKLWGIDKNYRNPDEILFWLGATGNKKFSSEIIRKLTDLVSVSLHKKIVFALGPADKEYLEMLPDDIQKNTILWQRSLRETAIFFSQFGLFLSADTGPMHLAVAIGLPTLSIFTNSKMDQYGYNKPGNHLSVALQDANCVNKAEIEMIKEFLKELAREG